MASERWDSTYPESCTGPDTQAPPHIKAREVCPKPGDLMWDTLENALKAGWRLAGVHMVGSESTRAYIRMIEEARAENGMSMEEIRAMGMTVEHCVLVGQQPDILQKLKDYGIIMSCGPNRINEAPDWIADYGPQIESFILPFRTWIESGVKVVGQHYGGGAFDQRGTGNGASLLPAVAGHYPQVQWQGVAAGSANQSSTRPENVDLLGSGLCDQAG